MHPGLRVLIHSHQFRCVARLREGKSPAGAQGIGGQLGRQFPPAAPHTARTSCKHCGHVAPSKTCPPLPPTTLTADHTTTAPRFAISTTSLFVSQNCVFRANDTTQSQGIPHNHVTLAEIIRVFCGDRPCTITTVPTPQVSPRRACQANDGLFAALPTPPTETRPANKHSALMTALVAAEP
jgi:hypothetical protein